jgi:type II secretory pathway component PulF
MIRPLTRTLIVLSVLVGGLVLLGLVVAGLFLTGLGQTILLVPFALLGVGWMAYAFLRYRAARQDELLQVLATAVEANLPLAPAVRAYLRDRPREGEGHVWDALLLVLFFPGDWLWLQRYSFDYKADELADLLGAGVPLPVALREVRGVAPREVRVAATVGESTGRLAACLRRADSPRLAGAWLEIVPRLLYPLFLLLVIIGITGFLMTVIMPKLQRIFADFHEELPWVTQRLLEGWEACWGYWVAYASYWSVFGFLQPYVAVTIPVLVLGLVASLPIANPAVRWHLPLLGRLYRWEVQGLVLRMLGTLLECGRPVPESLALLAESGDFPEVARRCLASARRSVERGDALAAALRRAGLLPASMVPLVQASERARTLPWALVQLGDLLAGRAIRVARRLSLVAFPAMVVAVGVLVGFVILGMFMPLIELLSSFST